MQDRAQGGGLWEKQRNSNVREEKRRLLKHQCWNFLPQKLNPVVKNTELQVYRMSEYQPTNLQFSFDPKPS